MHVAIGTLVAMALVFFATSLQTGGGGSPVEMLNAQRHSPQLWVVDLCALGLIAGMWWVAVLSNHFQGFIEYQATQHHDQLNDMIERTSELEQTNDSYADQLEQLEVGVTRRFTEISEQISALETVAEMRRKVFEMEARRMAESANHDLLTQLNTNTDQVEAVAASLQVHRSELRRLRHAVHGLNLSIPGAISTENDVLMEGPRYLLNGLGQRTPISTSTAGNGASAQNGHAAPKPAGAGPQNDTANLSCNQDCVGTSAIAAEPNVVSESIA